MKGMDASVSGRPTTGNWTLLEGDRELAVATGWDGLEAALRDLPDRVSPPNAIATLVAPNSDTLSIGIAGPRDGDNLGLDQALASVEFNRASMDPPYLVVVGDSSLTFENGGVVVFRFAGEWTEILRRNCVPVERMLDIVKYFVDEMALPEWIKWEQV